jgi:hypothetical protein
MVHAAVLAAVCFLAAVQLGTVVEAQAAPSALQTAVQAAAEAFEAYEVGISSRGRSTAWLSAGLYRPSRPRLGAHANHVGAPTDEKPQPGPRQTCSCGLLTPAGIRQQPSK